MEATTVQTPLNAIQRHLLQMFNEEGLKEMQFVLFNYYRDKLKEQTRDFWESN